MTNNNHYDQDGLGPLATPGNQRIKTGITVPPGFLSHYKKKRQNCQISKCGTARGKMSIPKIITDSTQIIFGMLFGSSTSLFPVFVLNLVYS